MASLAEQFLDDVDSSQEGSETPQPGDASDEIEPVPKPSKPTLDEELTKTLANIENRISVSAPASASASKSNADPSDTEYSLVIDCAAAIAQIDEVISSFHRNLLAAYSPAFPELDTLIINPMDYARVAQLAATHSDLASVDFRPILPSASVISVQVTASSSAGRALSAAERTKVLTIADAMLDVDAKRTTFLDYITAHAKSTAPNLVAIVGGAVAAKLIAHAGGLKPLACMPSGNLKVLGKHKQMLQGTSSKTTRQHDGIIHTCALVNTLPPKLRSRGGDITAGKACLAARVDAARQECAGKLGERLREALEVKFAKMQERPPARTAKPLPIPGDDRRRRHRAGARARKEKERMGITDARTMANRQMFGQPENERGNDLENEGVGMLGSQALRVRMRKSGGVRMAASRKLDKMRKRDGRSEAEKVGIVSSVDAVAGRGDAMTRGETSNAGVGGDRTVNGGKYFSASTPFLGVDKTRREIKK